MFKGLPNFDDHFGFHNCCNAFNNKCLAIQSLHLKGLHYLPRLVWINWWIHIWIPCRYATPANRKFYRSAVWKRKNHQTCWSRLDNSADSKFGVSIFPWQRTQAVLVLLMKFYNYLNLVNQLNNLWNIFLFLWNASFSG